MSWLLPTAREEILIVSFDFDLVIKNDRGRNKYYMGQRGT